MSKQSDLEIIAKHGFEVYLGSDGVVSLARYNQVVEIFVCPEDAIDYAKSLIEPDSLDNEL